MAVEKMCEIQVPDRCQWYRMILGEMARIADHLTCTGAMAMELGAFTPFLWFLKAREIIYDLFEEETGARLTQSFARIGGMAQPPTPQLKEMCDGALPRIVQLVEEGEKMLLKNRIFLDRLENVGVISKEDAIALSWTGPCLRASGSSYDVRKAHPYMKYDAVDFDVPVGKNGDTLDRFLVRLAEIRQSRRIIEQCLAHMADSGPINVDDPRVMLPEKARGLHDDRGDDPPLQAHHGRRQGPGGRGLLVHRGRQRRARLLPRLGRQRSAVPGPHPPPVLPDHRRALEARHGAHAERRRPHLRLAEHDRRRVRPLNASQRLLGSR